jgi:hypothetical protein
VPAADRGRRPLAGRDSNPMTTSGETSGRNYTMSFVTDRSPEEVFDTVKDVRTWWSTGVVEGESDRVGAEFTYRYADVHYCKQRITEFVPGKRLVWNVLEADISFVEDRHEWEGTDVVIDLTGKDGGTEVRFTHIGLVPAFECYDRCVDAWGHIVGTTLRGLITTSGTG